MVFIANAAAAFYVIEDGIIAHKGGELVSLSGQILLPYARTVLSMRKPGSLAPNSSGPRGLHHMRHGMQTHIESAAGLLCST